MSPNIIPIGKTRLRQRAWIAFLFATIFLLAGCPLLPPTNPDNSNRNQATDNANSSTDNENSDGGNQPGGGSGGNGSSNSNDTIASIVRGSVTRQSGEVVPNALVRLLPSQAVTRADATGNFRFEITAPFDTPVWVVSDNVLDSRNHYGISTLKTLRSAETDLGAIRVATRILETPLYASTTTPECVAIADLDSDGALDVVADGRISFNDGAGTFEPPYALLPVGTDRSAQQLPIIADLNADGLLDVAFFSQSPSERVWVALAVSAGRFTTPIEHNVGPYVNAIAGGDIDGDGDVDIVLSRSIWAAIGVMKNNGDGSFPDPKFFDFERRPEVVRLADMDGDGDLDAVAPLSEKSYGGDDGAMGLFRNDGTGAFSAPELIDAGTNPGVETDGYKYQFRLADIDADADIDIVTVARPAPAERNTAIALVRNQGDGTFAAAEFLASATIARRVAIGDRDGDGDVDLVVAADEWLGDFPIRGYEDRTTPLYQRVAVSLFNDGEGVFAVSAPQPYPEFSVADLADTDADGDLDIVWYDAAPNAGQLHSLFNPGDGTIRAPLAFQTLPNARTIRGTDVDADGDLDVVVGTHPSHQADSFVQMLRNDGTGAMHADSATVKLGRISTEFEVVDLNGDAAPDIISTHTVEHQDDQLAIHLNRGDWSFVEPTNYDAGGSVRQLQFADLNGDSAVDIVIVNSGGTVPIAVVLNNGDGTFLPRVGYFLRPDPYSLSLRDTDSDGFVDIVAVNYVDSRERCWTFHNNGAGGFDPPIEIPSPPQQPDVDLDLDGDLDMLTYSSENVSRYDTNIYMTAQTNTGNSEFVSSDPLLIAVHSGGFLQANPFGYYVADFNGDAYPDLLAYQQFIVNSHGSFFQFEPYDFGYGPGVIGDFDSDGDLDFVLLRNPSPPSKLTNVPTLGVVLRNQSTP